MANGTIHAIGTVYEAAWTATNTNQSDFTGTITLPPGTYVVTYAIPVMATEGSAIAALSKGGTLDVQTYKKMSSYESRSIIYNLSVQTALKVISASNHSIAISYTDRGFLKAIRVA